MALSNASKAGLVIFIGAVQFGIFLVVSEVLYSAYGTNGYSMSANLVSDLGANCPTSGACYIPPSALVYNTSVALLGLLVLLGAYFLQKAFHWTPGTAMAAGTAVGAIGVGLFPETAGILHSVFSLIVFLFAGLTALVNARLQRKPMFYLSVVLGLATLAALVLYVGGNYLGLGAGGMERMVVYPALLWGVGFGGHMMAIGAEPSP
jgi:hypothetical membrane protein